jgi:hypothetical protein
MLDVNKLRMSEMAGLAAVDKIMAADLTTFSANARKVSEGYTWEKQEQVMFSVYKEGLACVV